MPMRRSLPPASIRVPQPIASPPPAPGAYSTLSCKCCNRPSNTVAPRFPITSTATATRDGFSSCIASMAGKVNPAESAEAAYAVSSSDSAEHITARDASAPEPLSPLLAPHRESHRQLQLQPASPSHCAPAQYAPL